MRTRWCLTVVLCLAAAPSLRASPAELVGPRPSVPRLVEQLGDADYRQRDLASRLLRELGPDALPELRAAREHAEPEVRRRLDEIVPALEADALLAPKVVTLDVRNRPIAQVFQEITRQTGYKVEVFGAAPQQAGTFHFDRVPFWQALEQVAGAGGLVYWPYFGDEAVHLQTQAPGQESYAPYVCYDGCFRLVASGFSHSRTVNFATRPKAPAPLHRTDSLSFSFSICAEPKLPLLGAGEPHLEAAYDNENNSLVPPPGGGDGQVMHHTVMRYGNGFRVYNQEMQVPLARPSERATRVKLIRGTVPLTVLVSQKPEVVTDQLMSAKGKKFKVGDTSFAVTNVASTPNNQYHLGLTVTNEARDATDNDYTWVNSLHARLEVLDEKGHKYQNFGSSWGGGSGRQVQMEFTYGQPGNQKLPPPKTLVFQDWRTMQTQARFTFKDLPLP